MNELLKSVPESYFASVSTLNEDLEIGEKPLINLAVGVPDGSAPESVKEAVKNAVEITDNHKYTGFLGRPSFKAVIINFYIQHYDVDLKDEYIAILFGRKRELFTLLMSFIVI